VDFHEIWQEGDAIEGDFKATYFNLVVSAIPNGASLNF
jgi:hypothetical protein